MSQPNLVLILSIVFGALTTFFIVLALATDGWEVITYDPAQLRKIPEFVSNESVLQESEGYYKMVLAGANMGNKSTYILRDTSSGIWTLCDFISDGFRQGSVFQDALKAQNDKYLETLVDDRCFNYITEYQDIKDKLVDTKEIGIKSKSLFRMHNSAASCGIVSILSLFTAVITGSFGIWQRQVSATMVTGVMYSVAGVFLCFTLIITLTKVGYQQDACYSLIAINKDICESRSVQNGWSEPIGWVGFSLSVVTLGFWLFLARFFRIETAKSLI